MRAGGLLKVTLENFVTCFIVSTASISLEMLLEGPWMGLTEDFLMHLQGNGDSKPCCSLSGVRSHCSYKTEL